MTPDPETLSRLALGLIFAGVATIGVPHRLRADRAGGRVSRRDDPKWFWRCMAIVGPATLLPCLAFLVQPRWVDAATFHSLGWLRLLGLPFAIAGTGLFAWMFRHLGLNVTPTSVPRANATLVTSGPYRWVRHPMYSAALLLAFAAAFLSANVIVLVGGVLMFALLAARSRIEEQRLVGKFGDAYRDYQSRTGRFLPWSQ